jgi:conserved oligomeric Golgi complex subunit 3
MENLCDYLYDDLRPRILHEPRLTALCEVCTVIQALMVLDGPALPSDSSAYTDSTSDSEGESDSEDEAQDTQLHISHVLQMILQDAQTRLFFKAQSVVQSDIRYFAPKEQDLAYPDKLVEARKLTSAGGAPVASMIKEKESYSQLFQQQSLAKQDTWYPTLQKTVWVLSQLHDFVKVHQISIGIQEVLQLTVSIPPLACNL